MYQFATRIRSGPLPLAHPVKGTARQYLRYRQLCQTHHAAALQSKSCRRSYTSLSKPKRHDEAPLNGAGTVPRLKSIVASLARDIEHEGILFLATQQRIIDSLTGCGPQIRQTMSMRLGYGRPGPSPTTLSPTELSRTVPEGVVAGAYSHGTCSYSALSGAANVRKVM